MLKALVAVVLAAALPAFAAGPAPGTKPAVLAYFPDFGPASAALKARYANFNQLATDVFNAKADGTVSGKVPYADLDFARSKGMTTFATVSNYSGGDFNAALGRAIITSPALTKAFIAAMTEQLVAGHYNGLNVDFESIAASDRNAFTAFIGEVSRAMHQGGYLLVVSLPAEQKDDPADSWTGAYDFKALGGLVDVLQLMTYDENGSWGPAGPVAGLDWVEGAVKYTASVVPPGKISLGIPTHAFDWDLTDKTKNKQTDWTRIPGILARNQAVEQWDDASSSPFLKYKARDGHDHVVWYENARSLGLKCRLVAAYHLAGISVWALGMENAKFWQAITLVPPG